MQSEPRKQKKEKNGAVFAVTQLKSTSWSLNPSQTEFFTPPLKHRIKVGVSLTNQHAQTVSTKKDVLKNHEDRLSSPERNQAARVTLTLHAAI